MEAHIIRQILAFYSHQNKYWLKILAILQKVLKQDAIIFKEDS
jgi:hypothetical protein